MILFFKRIFFLLGLVFFLSCGSGSDSSNAVGLLLTKSQPTSGKPGDIIYLEGQGFSAAAPENIIFIGQKTTLAQSYKIIQTTSGNTEQIEFQIPLNATLGDTSLFIMVNDQASNSIPFTID
ncbi:MAG: IPT/TIG domain-containing protein [Deltaproteobacteria bacterium]|nr:IPT/TIG domain-containing protein [Deltaproteobacteria bacterium]